MIFAGFPPISPDILTDPSAKEKLEQFSISWEYFRDLFFKIA